MEKGIPQRTGKKEDKRRKIVGEITTLCQEREPLMLGSTLDTQVQAYLIATCKAGRVVNSEVAIAAAVGIV